MTVKELKAQNLERGYILGTTVLDSTCYNKEKTCQEHYVDLFRQIGEYIIESAESLSSCVNLEIKHNKLIINIPTRGIPIRGFVTLEPVTECYVVGDNEQ